MPGINSEKHLSHEHNTTAHIFKKEAPASAGENMQTTFRKPLDNKVSFRDAAGESKERLRSNPKIKPRQPSCQASTAKSTYHTNTTPLLIYSKRKPRLPPGKICKKLSGNHLTTKSLSGTATHLTNPKTKLRQNTRMNMAFGQKPRRITSWGDAPGYDDIGRRPNGKEG